MTNMIQSGVALFSLPRTLAQAFGYNGWLFLFGYLTLSTFNILLIALVYKLGNRRSIFDILEQSMPKLLLYPIYVLMSIVWLFVGCLVAKEYVFIFQLIAFPSTHPMFFKLLIDILAFMLIVKGIYSISKASTLFYMMTIWMILLLLKFTGDIEWSRYTPYILHGELDLVHGGLKGYSAFLGYELSLLLIPYTAKSNKFTTAVLSGNLMTTIVYLMISIVCFGFYSYEQLSKTKYPVIELLAYLKFPFIERVENLLYGLFLFTVLFTIVMYVWSSVETLKRMVPNAKASTLTIIMFAISFTIAWIPDVLSETESWLYQLSIIEMGIAFGLPLLLITLLLSQGKRKQHA